MLPARAALLTRASPIWLAVAVGFGLSVATAALYIRTLAPSVMPGDYAEFQLCAAVLGVPHPTGYPLYVLLGKLFTMLPVGDVAYRVNLSSAVYMAGAATMLYAVGIRLAHLMHPMRAHTFALSPRQVAATAAVAALFAVAPTVWSMALVARSYALNALLVGGVLFSLLAWRHTGRPAWFYASCALIGLSMVHHGTTYLLLPAYGLYLLIIEVERHRRRSDLHPMRRRALGALSFLAGLSPLLFLVYRFLFGSPYYWGNPTTWKDFFSLLTGGPFHNQVMGFGTGIDIQLQRVVFGVGELSAQFTPAGIVAGLLGAVILWRTSRDEAALLTLMLLGNFTFAMNYALVGYLYFIPTYLIWALLVLVFVFWVLDRADRAPLPQVRGALIGLTLPVLFVGALVLAVVRYPGVDQSWQTSTRDEALALLNSVPRGASLYLDWEDLSVVRFYRMVYGMRPDLTLYTGDPADWPKWAYCDLQAGRPVYIGEFAGSMPPIIARDFALGPAPSPMVRHVVGVLNSVRYEVPPCGACATCR
jgi:hypothetical protein